MHGYADDLQIHSHYLAHKISQLTICLTHFIHVVNHLILNFEQSGWGLVESMHLRSNRHQRRNNIQHGS